MKLILDLASGPGTTRAASTDFCSQGKGREGSGLHTPFILAPGPTPQGPLANNVIPFTHGRRNACTHKPPPRMEIPSQGGLVSVSCHGAFYPDFNLSTSIIHTFCGAACCVNPPQKRKNVRSAISTQHERTLVCVLISYDENVAE
mmetsp:Transcript_27050/g.48762  ORF Transcript_27050/g.48762 Transcript_27050/m.48762 type:complete len:145 (-) Transcript_27050:307-741(-)